MPTVLLIDVPEARALGLEERLAPDGCLVRRAAGWPAGGLDATDVDVVLAHTANPAALALAMRRLSRAPLVLVTDAAATDRVAALTCGADVCLAESEPDPVVEAHVTSLLRRWQPRVRHQLETVQVGELSLDPPGRRAQVGGADLELRPREFDLLVALARSAGRAFRRHELLDQVWGPRFTGGVNTVDVHISWLRQKLPAAARVRITTLRGVGYRLDELSRVLVPPAVPEPVRGNGLVPEEIGITLPESPGLLPESKGLVPENGSPTPASTDVVSENGALAPGQGALVPENGGLPPEGGGLVPESGVRPSQSASPPAGRPHRPPAG